MIPQNSAEHMYTLLPAAASLFLKHAENCLERKTITDNSSLSQKIQVFEDHFEIYSLDNCSRHHNLSFEFSENGYFFIARAPEAISKFIFLGLKLRIIAMSYPLRH